MYGVGTYGPRLVIHPPLGSLEGVPVYSVTTRMPRGPGWRHARIATNGASGRKRGIPPGSIEKPAFLSPAPRRRGRG